MSVLTGITGPEDVKKLSEPECRELAEELRREIIDTVSRQGGHLASNLGVVELTIALHRAFESPKDKLVFDVGHQVYAHKLLTGRGDRFRTLRSYGGISGFPCQAESEHDLFDTGHSSTAISMALGLARARDLKGEDSHVVAIVGDGALTGGMCYEAMNDAGNAGTPLIVVLNDNEMSISPNVGALHNYFKHLRASASWYGNKRRVRTRIERIPVVGKPAARLIEKIKDMVKSVTTGGELFESLGFRYWGPFDGHNIEEMTHVFEEAKRVRDMPLLIHVVTRKGNGYDLAERQPEKYHGTAPFFVENGMKRSRGSGRSASEAAGDALVSVAAEDSRVVAITAAMAGGTGLTKFASYYPQRFFDVGIAEQHALSMAAGLARGGFRPFFAVYATFLQRAYDQLIHDVCLQNLPVCVLVDHAGLVGDDGKTHHGVFVSQMSLSVPNLTVLAPKDTAGIARAIRAALKADGPVVIEYPKEGIPPCEGETESGPLTVGRWQILTEGTDCALLAYGRMCLQALDAAKQLKEHGISACVVDCCSLKPMDLPMLRDLNGKGLLLFTVEDGQAIGGFGSEVARLCIAEGLRAPAGIAGIGDCFVPHGQVDQLLQDCGLAAEQIAERVTNQLKERKYAGGQAKGGC